MGKRFYSDEDKSRAYVALTVHEGNITRAARETGIAASTLRDWRDTWEREGVPEELAVQAAEEADDFVRQATLVRNEALIRARELIPGSTKIAELTTLAGVLDDKIYRATTIRKPEGTEGPKQIDAAAAGELLAGFVREAMRSAQDREASVAGEENTPAKELSP